MKRILAVMGLLWASAAFGQVFTTLYLPTAGSGLTLNIAAGRAFCGGSNVTYGGGTLTMAPSATNNVYLNTASSCAPAVKSTAFTTSDFPIAIVVTSGSAITGITDKRTMFNQPPAAVASGVQYNPDTTSYIVGSFSGLYDDGDSHSTNLGVPTSVSCVHTATSSCTVVMPTAHGLAVGGAIDMFNLASWPYGQQAAQFGSFQVTTVPNSTTITFTTPTTLTYTCGPCTGNVYDASFWGIWEFAREPYIYGHGTVYGIQNTSANIAANFAAYTAGLAGTPTFYIDQSGQNDFGASATTSQVEGYHQTIWAAAHTAGMITVQSTMVPALYGFTPADIRPSQLNYWYFSQACTPSNKASKQCIDRYIDTASVLQTTQNAAVMPEPGANQRFADKLNEAFGVQKSSAAIPPTQLTFSANLSNNLPGEFTGDRKFFYDGSWNTWMDWNPTDPKGLTLFRPLTIPTLNAACLGTNGAGTVGVGTLCGGFNGGLGTSYQDATEIATPANPSAGVDRLYLNNSTHKVACLTSSGADCMPGSLPLTTKGDLLGYSTLPVRVPVGSDGQTPIADHTQATGWSWQTPGSSSGTYCDFNVAGTGTYNCLHSLGVQYPLWSCTTISGATCAASWFTWIDANNVVMSPSGATHTRLNLYPATVAGTITTPIAPTYATGCASTSSSCTATATAGQLAIAMYVNGGSTPFTMASSPSNTWVAASSIYDTQTFYSLSVAAGSTSFTGSTSGGSSFPGVYVNLFTPGTALSIDGTPTRDATGPSGTFTSSAFSTTGHDLVVLCAHASGGSVSMTAGTIGGVAATLISNTSGSTPGAACEYVTFIGPQTNITATMTSSNSGASWGGTVLAFKF
jgi:hypothetical protein